MRFTWNASRSIKPSITNPHLATTINCLHLIMLNEEINALCWYLCQMVPIYSESSSRKTSENLKCSLLAQGFSRWMFQLARPRQYYADGNYVSPIVCTYVYIHQNTVIIYLSSSDNTYILVCRAEYIHGSTHISTTLNWPSSLREVACWHLPSTWFRFTQLTRHSSNHTRGSAKTCMWLLLYTANNFTIKSRNLVR